jgi:hypothetical protein
MKIEKPRNSNYCATVISIDKLVPLPKCDNVQAAIIFFNQIVVGKDVKVGDVGLYFPIECKLSDRFLSANNLYRHSEKNIDQTKKGYFEDHGRIKAVKFRGNKSEGLFVGLNHLSFLLTTEEITSLKVGDEFDMLNDVKICEKYIPRHNPPSTKERHGKTIRTPRKTRVIDKYFHFHIETCQFRKNVHRIDPYSYIWVSSKIHGTSSIYANVPVKKKLNWWQKFLRFVGAKIEEQEYDLLYSSRKVIKNNYVDTNPPNSGFYTQNIWEIVANEIRACIGKGITIYGEIVGYLPNGGWIQKDYHYGCKPGEHKFAVYRMTFTNDDGQVFEFNYHQIKEYCARVGLTVVPFIYWGRACDMFPEIVVDDNWHSNFLDALEKKYVNDAKCALNNFEVVEEGIVVKMENMFNCEPMKLKNWEFLKKESDDLNTADAPDIETQESLGQ